MSKGLPTSIIKFLTRFFFLFLQRATLAEKEVSTLKEELSVTRTINSCMPATQTATAQQNGIPPSLASPMSDDCNSSANNLSSKSLNNNKSDEINENKMDVVDMHHHHHNHNNNSSRSTPALDKDGNGGIDHHNSNNNLSSRLIGDEELAAKDKEVSSTAASHLIFFFSLQMNFCLHVLL